VPWARAVDSFRGELGSIYTGRYFSVVRLVSTVQDQIPLGGS